MVNNLGRIIKDILVGQVQYYETLYKRGSHVQILVSKGVLGTNL